MTETAVTSFVVRFMQEDPAADAWRGFIRHVQTSQEIHFTTIEEALTFMGQYVKIDLPLAQSDPHIETDEAQR